MPFKKLKIVQFPEEPDNTVNLNEESLDVIIALFSEGKYL
jgi:hypothetical protein